MAAAGSRPKVMGSTMTSPKALPRPGSTPMTTPKTLPASSAARACQEKARDIASGRKAIMARQSHRTPAGRAIFATLLSAIHTAIGNAMLKGTSAIHRR